MADRPATATGGHWLRHDPNRRRSPSSLECDIQRANTTCEVEKLEDRLAWIGMAVKGAALGNRLVRASAKLERQRYRLS
ncbi:MAG: hypothetical protein JW751_03385 [Polyangiaceae bacterium]|nr:hypothetical protein [Polyangiaceae bacterium]